MTIRAVFDCVVLLQAAANEAGPAGACLRLAQGGLVRLYVSEVTLAEARDVLSRPAIRKKFRTLTDRAS